MVSIVLLDASLSPYTDFLSVFDYVYMYTIGETVINKYICYIAEFFPPPAHALIGYFEVT